MKVTGTKTEQHLKDAGESKDTRCYLYFATMADIVRATRKCLIREFV